MTAAAWPAARVAAPASTGWMRYMGTHGKSFAFASAFMPAADRARIAGVYAWCRCTDDMVDVSTGDGAEGRLDGWLALSRAAYDGHPTGVELLDTVMPAARAAGVPFRYPGELIEGMRMDLHHEPFATMDDLRVYLWRAAGTVGLWLATMYGIRDPWALERAALLGQAMQLTNIIRDVGEDLDRGRSYLPVEMLRAHGLTLGDLVDARRARRSLGRDWSALVEELIAIAERDYTLGREALFVLPPGFRRAAAVASHVYAGIHDAVRRIGHQSLHARASTSPADKFLLAVKALGTS